MIFLNKVDDNVLSFYNGLDGIYSKVEDLMGSVYLKIKNDPSNVEAKEMLAELNSIAQSILYVQMDFVKNYCNKDVIVKVIGELKDRANSLESLDHVKKR